MKYLVGVTDYVNPPFDVEAAAFPEAEFVNLGSEDEKEFSDDVLDRLDALVVWHAHIGPYTAERLAQAKIVVRYGVGFDGINVKSLDDKGIVFCNTPDYGTEEVADTACAMILNLQRKVSIYDFACREYKSGWQENVLPPLRRTNKQTLGVLGVGRIGTAVINRMRGFGYDIIGYDPYVPSGHDKAIGYKRFYKLNEFLTNCDVLTIHCPLNDETRGLIDDRFVSSMKPGAALVCTSRGPVIKDLDCLYESIQSGKLSAVALDVLPEEPPSFSAPLIKAWKAQEEWLRGRLIINPHSSYFSDDALYEMRFKAAETTRLCLVDGIIRNQIRA
ncbi:C-terminal binding protein [Pseudomonadota bacterium]